VKYDRKLKVNVVKKSRSAKRDERLSRKNSFIISFARALTEDIGAAISRPSSDSS